MGGVDGGEGNRVGRMGGGEGGKNTSGFMGEAGEGEACFEAGLLRELGGMELWSGLGDAGVSSDAQGSGEGQEAAVAVGDAPGAGVRTPCLLGGFSREAAGASRSGDSVCGLRRVAGGRVFLSRAVRC